MFDYDAKDKEQLKSVVVPEPIQDRGPDAVRRLLVDAAVDEVSDRRPDEVTAKQIAERAGVNHGQIHHLFGSKDHLMAEALQARLKRADHFSRVDSDLVPIQAHERPEIWRTIAHLATTIGWSTDDATQVPKVLVQLIDRHAGATSRDANDAVVIAEVAAVESMSIGWWIYEDMIVEALKPFGVDRDALAGQLAARSVRILDPSADIRGAKPVRTMPAPAVELQPSDGPELPPRGRDEVSRHLIEATISLLVDRPVSALTNKDIAALAGVNHGQIHHYFDSKEHLIAEAVRHEGRTSSRGLDFPLPLLAHHRHPLWRALVYLAATDDWGVELARQTPLTAQMVGFLSESLALEPTDPVVHGQVAAIQALENGWEASRDRVDAAAEYYGVDHAVVYHHVSQMSCRLVDHENMSDLGS